MSKELMRHLIPLIGSNIREKIWMVRYMPTDVRQSDFFRIFVGWEELLDSMCLPVLDQHPTWQHPFEVWQINFEDSSVQEISIEILNLIEARRTGNDQENEEVFERSHEEANNDKAD